MSLYKGDFLGTETIPFPITTNDGSGGRVEPNSAFEVADIRIYKGVSATQRSSEAGYAIAPAFDSMVGVQMFSVDLSDNTDVGFFEAGNDYCVVLYPDETIDSQSVSKVIGMFSIQNRSSSLNATARGNLEDQYDGTGITGDTYPSTQAQLGNITNSGSAVNTTATSATITTGTQASGTYVSTHSLDGVYHQIQDSAGTTDVYYETSIGSGTPSSVTFDGRLNSSNDSLGIYGYDWISAGWVQIGTLDGKNGSTDEENTYQLTTSMVGTGVDLGKVRVRFYDTGLTSSNLYVDRFLFSFNQGQGGYVDGIEVDTNKSNTNTVPNVDGVKGNPVSTWASALTLSASTGITKFNILNASAITLSADSSNYQIIGTGYTLALGGQNITGISVKGASITGIGTNGGAPPHFRECAFGAVTLPPCRIFDSGIGRDGGTFTGGSAGEFHLIGCESAVAGMTVPNLVFSGLGSTTEVNVRGWLGGSNYTLDSNCTLSHEVLAGGGQTFTTGGADVELRGIFSSSTYVLSGAGTIQQVGVCGPITISGTATTTVNLYGSSSNLADTSVSTNVNDKTVSEVDVDAILTDTSTTIPSQISGLNDISASEVNAEVLDVMRTDTHDEPSQGAPAKEISMGLKLDYLYKFARNLTTQTATEKKIYSDDGVTVDHKATISDDSTTFTEGELGSGA